MKTQARNIVGTLALGISLLDSVRTIAAIFPNVVTTTNDVGINGNIFHQFSSPGGGAEIADMLTQSNSGGHAIGVSYGGIYHAWMWNATGQGKGSNFWGGDFSFPGGLQYAGNPYWLDLPQTIYADQSFYWGMGPAASMASNAWPHGQTNPSVQPGFRIVNGNPFSGIAYIDVRTTFTNSAHGSLVGTNYDGVSMYLPGYGFTLGMISDAYGNPDPVTGIIDQIGKYSQQAPSINGIKSDPSLNFYITENAHRTGDPSYGGQAPLIVIQTDKFLDGDSEIIFRIPIQRGGVWDVRQEGANAPTNWLDAFSVNEKTSGPTVATTNSLLQIGTTLGVRTNVGSYVFGRLWDAATAQTEFQGTVNMDLPSQVYANYGAWTFDAAGTHRFGVVVTSGEYPHLGHASGSPFNISQYSVSDLSTISVGNQPTFTNELTINTDSTVLIPFGVGSKSANSSLAVGTSGITNTLTINYRLMGFTGTSVVQTNTVTHVTFSRGTISTATDIILQPNEAVRGSSCAAQAVQAF